MINPIKLLSNVKATTGVGNLSVRRVVLAGVGACRVGSEQLAMAQQLASKRVKSLVEEGVEVEAEMTSRLHDTRQVVLKQGEESINRVLKKHCGVDRSRLATIESKVDRLQAAITQLESK